MPMSLWRRTPTLTSSDWWRPQGLNVYVCVCSCKGVSVCGVCVGVCLWVGGSGRADGGAGVACQRANVEVTHYTPHPPTHHKTNSSTNESLISEPEQGLNWWVSTQAPRLRYKTPGQSLWATDP